MRKQKIKIFLVLFVLTFPLTAIYAQNISGGHRGKITSLIHNGDSIISAGEDGFIVTWNVKEKKSVERFQLTPYRIISAIKHPSRAEICIVEAAGVYDYRVSVWNYILKNRLFSTRSSEPVSLLNYSAGGNFIIVSGFNGSPITLLDSGTGQIAAKPDIPQGNVPLAITGRAERSMLIYQTDTENGGQLLYLNLEESAVTGSFQTRDNLLNPLIFGNGRFLAGTSSLGLFVIDAASGNEVANFKNIERGAMLCPADDGFYCLSGKGAKSSLYRFSIGRNGRLSTPQEIRLSIGREQALCALAYNGSAVLACEDGSLFLFEQNGNTAVMSHNFQTRVSDIAASSSSVAVLTEEGGLFFLPLEYALLEDGETLSLEKKDGYTQLSALEGKANGEPFILWQKTNTRNVPLLVYPDRKTDDTSLMFLSGRYPIHSISSKNGMVLVLDKAGNLSIFDNDTITANKPASYSGNSSPFFSLSSIGAMDAAFIDSENILLCLSSVIAGSNPFVFINIKTHETIPVSYKTALTGLTAYTGKQGKVYAVALEDEDAALKTSVLYLTPFSFVKIFEYPGEDVNLSITESGEFPAIACGNEGAAIYGKEKVYFERTEGLPVKIIGCEKFFLCADSEGNISWHDNKTGKLLAVFKKYEDGWILTGDKTISGKFTP